MALLPDLAVATLATAPARCHNCDHTRADHLELDGVVYCPGPRGGTWTTTTDPESETA